MHHSVVRAICRMDSEKMSAYLSRCASFLGSWARDGVIGICSVGALRFAVLAHRMISGMPSCESGCNLTPPVVVRFQEAE